MKTNCILLSLALFFCLGVQTSAYSGPKTTFDVPKAQTEKIKAKVNSGEFSLSSFAFVENKGQVYGFDGLPHPEVKFSFQQGNTQIFLLEKGIAYQFTRMHYPEGYQEMMRDKDNERDMEKLTELQKQIRTETYRMDMTLKGANKNVKITTEGRSADYTNFYNRDVLDVHSYFKVTYHNIYPGIDWVIYTKGTEVKYDFIVKPGADPSLIKMQFSHQDDLELNKDGSFTLKNSLGSISEKAPLSFQGLFNIETKFKLKGNVISFDIGNYNSKETLVIDPTLVWATYYGGTGNDYGRSCSTDNTGNVFLAGFTGFGSGSTTGIALGGHQNTFGGSDDAFLVKFNTNGVRQWATYYGSTGNDQGYSCCTDGSGNVYLAGITNSSIGIASGGHQSTISGGLDAFLVKFNTSGVLIWASYYGGSGGENEISCNTDVAGNVYLVGYATASSITGIASGGHQNTHGGNDDAFLVKFNASGVRQWATYYGSTGYDYGYSCCADGSGNVYLAGISSSSIGIASGGHQNTFGGGQDVFLVKFNAIGVRQWSTYYGGVGSDLGYSCCTDGSGNIYIAGRTTSTINIALAGHQNSFGGGSQDAFLAKFNTIGVLQWATYYGGTGVDMGLSCIADGAGNTLLLGHTNSTGSIATGGYQNTYGGGVQDAFLVKFNAIGVRQWGTYYGGALYDFGQAIDIDGFGNYYLSGYTNSGSGIASGGHQNTFSGGAYDAYLVKLCDSPTQPTTISGNTLVCFSSIQTYSVTNNLSATSYSWSLFGAGWSGTSTTNSITTTAGNSGTISVTALNACGASAPQTITITTNPSPIISINSGSICEGKSFTLVPVGALTYTIEGGAAVISPSISSTYSVIGTNSLGCVSQIPATASVNVFSLPNISITGSVTIICTGESMNLSATGANSYTWSTGANSSSISVSPVITTTYSVTGEDANACENTSAFTLQVDECTGIDNTSKSETGMMLYPNPNNGMFYIETSQSLAVSIYNSLGQLIIQQKLSEGKNQINLHEHANGIYFIEINQNGKTILMKLIKE